ncbi:acylphosphatase [Corynebacterium mendelii]|uniref:acylphosphatase n=1 Tax=Corynebacterium mendelii TaxID=2765362 RepID=A0A939IX05_9CORY|nr:acylphosphatase [Corynebacterium mendelii]MBN9643162.1 acylphosphatase [Corynebacterium mendelii]
MSDQCDGEPGPVVRVTAWVHGRVQGVGFRWWTRSRALELGLSGSATNYADGRVLVAAEGPRAQCERLVELLSQQPSTAGRPGRVGQVFTTWGSPKGATGFVAR